MLLLLFCDIIYLISSMKEKKTIIKFNKYNIFSLISVISSLLGIILVLHNLKNFSIMLLIMSFLCFLIDKYYQEDNDLSKKDKSYQREISIISSFVSFTIYPSIIAIKSTSFWLIDVSAFIFIIASLIRMSSLNILKKSSEIDKNYHIGLPTSSIGIFYPLIYLFKYLNYNLYICLIVVMFLSLSIFGLLNIKIKKININKIINYFSNTKYSTITRVIINFILFPIFVAIASDLFFKVNTFDGFALIDALKVPINYPFPFIMVVLLFSLITIFFTGISKKTNHAKAIIMIILAIFLTINDFKYIIMNRPVVLSDVNFLNTSNMEMSALFVSTVKGIWVIKVLVKTIILLIIAFIFNKSKLSTIELKKGLNRIEVIFGSTLVFGCFIYFTFKNSFYMVTKTYNVPLEEIYKIEDYADIYYKQGIFQGILFNTYSSSVFEPSTYDRNEVKKLLNETSIEEENWGKPNIVIILSESFFDVDNLPEIKFNKDLMPNIHSYEKDDDKVVTNTYVSVFGGSSVVSEWETLTSATNQFNVTTYIPYTDYYLKKYKDNVKNSPHIIKSLNKEGYMTKYITPWASESYNSKHVYDMLGTDETIYDLKGSKKGLFLSDDDITENILNELNQNIGTPKLLIYATSQNHMPCEDNRYEKYDIDITSSSFDEEDTSLIKCYAQGVYDADKALGKLYEGINKLDENTIVIFYGDHLPFINNKKGTNSIKTSKYLNNKNKFVENLHNYTTKGVILSNYIDNMDQSINYINLNYLTAYVYAHLNILDKDYYNFVNNTRKIVPVFTRRYIYNPLDNKYTDLKDLSKETKKALENYRNVQYYEFFDK